MIKGMSLQGLNKPMAHYMSLSSFSPRSSDSEGTISFKRFKRDIICQKAELDKKLSDMHSAIQELRKQAKEKEELQKQIGSKGKQNQRLQNITQELHKRINQLQQEKEELIE